MDMRIAFIKTECVPAPEQGRQSHFYKLTSDAASKFVLVVELKRVFSFIRPEDYQKIGKRTSDNI